MVKGISPIDLNQLTLGVKILRSAKEKDRPLHPVTKGVSFRVRTSQMETTSAQHDGRSTV